MFRMGHKFAFQADLRRSLHQIISTISDKTSHTINQLSAPEKINWTKWKVNLIKSIIPLQSQPPRIESKIRKGLQHIKQLNCVIKQSDKNMGIIAIRGDIYNGLTRKWLKEPAFVRVNHFPHHDIFRRLVNIVTTHNSTKHIGDKWIRHADSHKEPNLFYSIPKIHKSSLGSRPITATHSYCLAETSSAVAKYLQLEVDKYPSIAQDSRQVIRQIEELTINQPFVFLTYDVEACYPNMDINHAINLISQHYNQTRDQQAWIKLLQLINFNNYVSYGGNIYRQMVGTATGSQVAPPFCNLYLYLLFKDILNHSSILFNSRYIDDGLLIVKNRDDASYIANRLNSVSNLNITWEITDNKAIYLDIMIYRGPRWRKNGIIDITTYFKPTNKLLYLPYNSSHPSHMKHGVAKGESIRLLRNNTNKENWIKQCMFVFKGLMARGYPPNKIKSAWKSIRFEDRDKYIWEDTNKTAPTGQIIVTTYHPLTKIYWKSLLIQHPFEDIFRKGYLGKYNQRQVSLLKKWPPTIIYGNFKRIGQHCISAKQSWSYPPLPHRRRYLDVSATFTPNKRRRI